LRPASFTQEIDHLRLEQHVERAGRLIQHDRKFGSSTTARANADGGWRLPAGRIHGGDSETAVAGSMADIPERP